MTLLAVHPQKENLEMLVKSLHEVYPSAKILYFTDPLLAYQHVFNHPVDAVYTAITMMRLDGFALAKMIRSTRPDTEINFVHETSAFYMDAQRLLVHSYILQPVTAAAIRAAQAEAASPEACII